MGGKGGGTGTAPRCCSSNFSRSMKTLRMPVKLRLSFLFNLLNVLQQLDTEVEKMKQSWETVREQDQLQVQDIKKMLQLQDGVKTKLRQVESILDLASRFHHTSRQVSSGFQLQQTSSAFPFISAALMER